MTQTESVSVVSSRNYSRQYEGNMTHKHKKKAPNLEAVLARSCGSPYSLIEFTNFLKKTRCFENYMFIQKIDEFSKESSIEKKKTAWLEILRDFVVVCSEYEINLNGDLRGKLLGNFDILGHDYSTVEGIKDLELPRKSTILEARDEAYTLLQDAYLQFLKSVAGQEDNRTFEDKLNIYGTNTRDHESVVLIGGNYCLTSKPVQSVTSANNVSDEEIQGLDSFVKDLNRQVAMMPKQRPVLPPPMPPCAVPRSEVRSEVRQKLRAERAKSLIWPVREKEAEGGMKEGGWKKVGRKLGFL